MLCLEVWRTSYNIAVISYSTSKVDKFVGVTTFSFKGLALKTMLLNNVHHHHQKKRKCAKLYKFPFFLFTQLFISLK